MVRNRARKPEQACRRAGLQVVELCKRSISFLLFFQNRGTFRVCLNNRNIRFRRETINEVSLTMCEEVSLTYVPPLLTFCPGCKQMISHFFRILPIELVALLGGLIFLAFLDPSQTSGITICPLKLLGFNHCPGCGLGRSVAFLLRGNIGGSLNAHILGPFAFVVIVHRITVLARNLFHHH